jgi:hypothetical protein
LHFIGSEDTETEEVEWNERIRENNTANTSRIFSAQLIKEMFVVAEEKNKKILAIS